eukprot:scaffold6123_cov113-Isochrysis_galbana.AAC.4
MANPMRRQVDRCTATSKSANRQPAVNLQRASLWLNLSPPRARCAHTSYSCRIPECTPEIREAGPPRRREVAVKPHRSVGGNKEAKH